MAKKPSPKEFQITARLVVISSINVVADTYESAIVKAKDLHVSDFVTVDGEHLDSSLRLVSVGDPKGWETDDY